jgi:hypothetical protein
MLNRTWIETTNDASQSVGDWETRLIHKVVKRGGTEDFTDPTSSVQER